MYVIVYTTPNKRYYYVGVNETTNAIVWSADKEDARQCNYASGSVIIALIKLRYSGTDDLKMEKI